MDTEFGFVEKLEFLSLAPEELMLNFIDRLTKFFLTSHFDLYHARIFDELIV